MAAGGARAGRGEGVAHSTVGRCRRIPRFTPAFCKACANSAMSRGRTSSANCALPTIPLSGCPVLLLSWCGSALTHCLRVPPLSGVGKVDVFAVTLEPAGGLSAPSGEMYLAGKS